MIKTHKSKNEYIRAANVWIRNYTKATKSMSISRLINEEDHGMMLENQTRNKAFGHTNIADERIVLDKIAIVSDGYSFESRKSLIDKLPNDVSVIAVNGALRKWNISRVINAYVINNPFAACLSLLPKHNYYPVCISSIRTNPDFIKKYKGNVYFYEPTPEEGFGFRNSERYTIDDYRNPICAAIGLAYRFQAKKLMLLCCDDSFENKREFAIQIENGLWTYPQHLTADKIIDGNLYWMTHQEEGSVEVANYSDGLEYKNALYINSDEEAINFFNNEEGAR